MSKTKTVPAYLTLVLNVLTRAQKLGLSVERDLSTRSTLPENSGHCFVRVDGGTAALIVPKHAGEVTWCDSHIDWKGERGYMPHPTGDNGAVSCRIDPSEADLDLLLTRLSGAQKASRKAGSKAASQATEEMIALLKTIGIPVDPEQDSEPVPTDEEEMQGEFLDA